MTAARNDILPDARVYLPAPPTAPTDAVSPADAGDCPWAHCESSAATRRPEAGLWIEELLADVDSRR